MIHRVYAVLDAKAGLFGLPFFQMTDEAAIRAFTDMATRSDTLIGSFPDDFSLYFIGTYDDDKAKLDPASVLDLLGVASTFVVALNRVRGALRDVREEEE